MLKLLIVFALFIINESFISNSNSRQFRKYQVNNCIKRNDDIKNIPLSNYQINERIIQTTTNSLLITIASVLSIPSPSKSDDENISIPIDYNNYITNKVYFNIKIANYTEESTGTNKGASGSGKIVIGLFGNIAPNATKLFLSAINSNPEDNPSYLNSQFLRINEQDGLLQLEKLRGLDTIILGGSEQYEFRNRVITDYQPFVEVNSLKHSTKGLLTRKQFSGGPEFSITTRSSSELDSFHEVFGVVIEGLDVIDAIANLPRYTYKTKTGYASSSKGSEGVIADAWFESQKKFYVGLGKSFGDRRAVDQRGKLLRRVLITGCGEIK